MPRKPETIPTFADEAEERAFWETQDSEGYVDWSKAERVRVEAPPRVGGRSSLPR